MDKLENFKQIQQDIFNLTLELKRETSDYLNIMNDYGGKLHDIKTKLNIKSLELENLKRIIT